MNEKVAAQGFSRKVAGPVFGACLPLGEEKPSVLHCRREADFIEGGNGVRLTHFGRRGVRRFVGKNPEGKRDVEAREGARRNADGSVRLQKFCRALRGLNAARERERCIRAP